MRAGAPLLGLALAVAAGGSAVAADWREELERWRAERARELAAPDGWLSVVGLFWLDEGETSFGSGADAAIPLRPPVPPLAGRLSRDGERVQVQLEAGVDAGLEGTASGAWRRLRTDADGDAEWLRFGRQRFHVIRRGDRFGVRLIDDEAPARARFEGLRWFPPREDWRVRARFLSHREPRSLPIANVIGQTSDRPSPGYALFELAGRELRLDPVLDGPPGAERLFFIFRDATSGHETYGAGRFLYAALPVDGVVVLDFNRAYSPPCAFTEYATCPLPPRSNWLGVPVEAGELDPGLLHPGP
jgi:hypothetical protein